ncbi:MAG: hypothetical protein CEN90_428 [Parcubacteria group bacterium Licking1014_17]|nr:MAG: hypothetical protein CEN90_428 [Parcubacteria group bacterium Licking1014_17]
MLIIDGPVAKWVEANCLASTGNLAGASAEALKISREERCIGLPDGSGGPIAQLVERVIRIDEAGSSNLPGSTRAIGTSSELNLPVSALRPIR